MIYSPTSTALNDAPTASELHCSRGANLVALTILDFNQTNGGGATYVQSINPVSISSIPNPLPLFGKIRYTEVELRLIGGVLTQLASSGDMSPWFLRKNSDETWRWWGPVPAGDPTPKAVRSTYNPRAWSNNTGDYATYGQFPHLTKLKVFGCTTGTLCQYAGKYYDAADVTYLDIAGPEDLVMVDEVPSFYSSISQGQSENFEFYPTDAPLTFQDDYPEPGQSLGGPALAIYWPGKQPSDFSWYP